MKLCPKDWNNQLERIRINMNEENGKSVGIVNEWARKVWRFPINEFLKNIGCLVSAFTFGIGGSRLRYK